MSNIFVDDFIITEEQTAIKTDVMPRPEKGEKGDKGDKGRDGKDGIDGKNGRDGRDGKDGKNGVDGKNGKDGRDGKDGLDGKNGTDGLNGKDGIIGKDGAKGEDGTQWYLFNTQVDDKKGLENDLALVQSTSFYYRKEFKGSNLIWVFKGSLKGKDGEKGDRGDKGSGGGGGFGIIQQTDQTITTIVLAGNTTQVAVIPLADFISLEFFINCRKADLTKSRTLKMLVNKLATSLQDTIYGLVGILNCEISIQLIGMNAELIIKNNEAFDILVSFKKNVLI